MTTGDAMHNVVFVMRATFLSVHRGAIRCVENLLSPAQLCHRLFIEDGACLVCTGSAVPRTRTLSLYLCALVVRKLSPIIGNHEPVVSRGGLHRSLCSAYRHRTHIEGRESPCSRGEARLAHERCEQDDPGGRGCLERAIQMGGDRDLKMRIYALGPLRHLSSESCGRYLVHV